MHFILFIFFHGVPGLPYPFLTFPNIRKIFGKNVLFRLSFPDIRKICSFFRKISARFGKFPYFPEEFSESFRIFSETFGNFRKISEPTKLPPLLRGWEGKTNNLKSLIFLMPSFFIQGPRFQVSKETS